MTMTAIIRNHLLLVAVLGALVPTSLLVFFILKKAFANRFGRG
jgi:hypothetical protein